MPYNVYGTDTTLFGVSVRMSGPNLHEPARQMNAYAGLNGVESLWLGLRGRVMHVKGRFFADTLDDMELWFDNLESYLDGVPRVLWSSTGRAWSNVLMGPVRRVGVWTVDPSNGFTQAYELSLLHMTTN